MQPADTTVAAMLLLPLLLLLGGIQAGNSIGYTTPSGNIYLLVNGTINITCNINLTLTNGRNSSALSWHTNSKPIDLRYMHILNESAIQLIIPLAQAHVRQAYICKLRNMPNSASEYSGVSYTDVAVGNIPPNVTNFQCHSHNWVNMTCTFKMPDNTVDANYKLHFRVEEAGRDNYECMLQPRFDRTYTCTLNMDTKSGIYRQVYPFYYFTLTAESQLGQNIECFTIDHFNSVISAPPQNLNYTDVSPNGVTLTWSTPLEMQMFPSQLTHSISYMSEYDNGVWHEMSALKTTTHKEPIRYQLTDLPYAFVTYDVRVRIRVSGAEDTPMMWSGNATLLFKSGSRIPDAPPATDVGGFYVDDNDHVYVYWRELPKHDENGPQFQYVVRSPEMDLQKPMQSSFVAKYANVRRNVLEDIHFDISSSNANGVSLHSSRVRVPRRSLRCPAPGEIRNILHNKNDPDRHYVFSWGRPTNLSAAHQPATITSYTVFWCKSRNESPNQCDGAFNFTRLPADTSSYTHASNDTLNFAVSANAADSSSGMSWARCTAIANNDISKVTDAKPTVGSDTATIEWNTACIDESLSHGYVITYCLVQGERDNSNCSEPPKNITVNGAAVHNYTIPALIPYRTYKVNIAARSAAKVGPLSDPVYFTTLESSPSPPRALTVLAVNSSVVKLGWEPPTQMNGVLNRYNIYFNMEMWHLNKLASPNGSVEYTRDGLDANTDYKITIRACTGAQQCSEPSNTVNPRTDIGRPGMVQLMANVPPSEIGWLEPLQAGGNLDYYELEVEHDGGRRSRVYVNGTRCTVAMAMCQTGEQSYTFRVRAVNVKYDPHSGSKRLRRQSDETATTLGSPVEPSTERTTTEQTTMAPKSLMMSTHSICVEEDDGLLERIRQRSAYAKHYPGEWLVVKNQDCRANNRTMYAVWTASLFGFMLVAYLCGTFAFRKLKRMKDIDVELPEGLQDMIQDIGTGIGGGSTLAHRFGGKGGGGGVGGIGIGASGLIGGAASGGLGGIGGGIGGGNSGGGLDVDRMAQQTMAEKNFARSAEQEERLLPATDFSSSRSELDDGRSSRSNSQCEDSDGGSHDGSSRRTLLIDAKVEFDKYPCSIFNPNLPPIRLPVFVPPTVPPMAAPETSAGLYVPAPIVVRPAPSFVHTNANGYVTHESLAAATSSAASMLEPAAPPPMPPAVPQQQPPNINGYLPWNAITAAALSAAAASSTSPTSTSISTASPSPADGSRNSSGNSASGAAAKDKLAAVATGGSTGTGASASAAAAAAAAADKTGISGYVTHKQLSDFGQLIQ